MLTPERHQIILNILNEKHTVKIQELVEATSSSESTIRRDLSQLEDQHLLRRVHGGASILHQTSEEPSIVEKSTKNLQEKQQIAKHAANLVREGDCIFLDAGTTTLEMIPFLKDKSITVVTNGLSHLNALSEQGMTAYVTGGYIKHKTGALIGNAAQLSLEGYYFDLAFLGTNGVDLSAGYTTPDPEEAGLKRTALHQAENAYILADGSKFNEITFTKIADIHEAHIITDQSGFTASEPYREKTMIQVVSS
ncbi:DeoR/GlpR family DNA-binding transcription regulator [Pontibacillus marinus]|uniref:DeoR family transcriptional regulator n=1 Tax=Pontibacillus marinus BH030004 = DSM 16465 TaxID=1385511 RepID=A0A0A5G0R5_9BACI|nr:DeoR/GlpR family DNA-binding transcription regulator [Pontibacillus marinus]KGX85629.1 DeoR family transcriptional regulator [Pontibacillus marinus BH030004 = DSM 16465]